MLVDIFPDQGINPMGYGQNSYRQNYREAGQNPRSGNSNGKDRETKTHNMLSFY